jgi:hypothetical protein
MSNNGVYRMKAHPYADIFPMMAEDEIQALTAAIGANGLLQPIVRYQGLILDGRNRLLACEMAGIEPTFVEHDGNDASAYAKVVSLNVQRRDLTAGQRALAAAKALEQMPERRGGDRRKGKVPESGTLKSHAAIAQQFKVGKDAVQQARALLRHAPDLAEQVEARLLNITNAYEEYLARKKQKAQQEKDKARIAEYLEAIENGEITYEQAMEKVMEEERKAKQKAEDYEHGKRLWFTEFANILLWAQGFVGDHSDEILASFASTYPDRKSVIGQIDAVIVHLERLRKIFVRPEPHAGQSTDLPV